MEFRNDAPVPVEFEMLPKVVPAFRWERDAPLWRTDWRTLHLLVFFTTFNPNKLANGHARAYIAVRFLVYFGDFRHGPWAANKIFPAYPSKFIAANGRGGSLNSTQRY